MKPWSLLGGGKVMFTMPRVAVIRGMIMNHIVHHRGQLSVYMRMCDVSVPAIHGPSANEAELVFSLHAKRAGSHSSRDPFFRYTALCPFR